MPLKRMQFGAILWFLSLQYYIVQIIVGYNWQGNSAFSLRNNTISDLGNTACAQYGDRFVCSPLHPVMNLSFVLLGFTMLGASYVLWRVLSDRSARVGLVLLGISGFGGILVGLFPENGVAWPHVLGAGLAFVGGNLALIYLAFCKKLSRILRVSAGVGGAIGLIALVFFITNMFGYFGLGGVERIVAYPQSIWMVLAGAILIIRR